LSARVAEGVGLLDHDAPGASAPTRGGRAVATQADRIRMRWLVVASALVLFLVTLYPRMVNLGGYLTTDEGNWMGRTALFTRALVTGDAAGTYQSGHPGVMTMWLSLIGMGPDRALGLVEYVRPDGLDFLRRIAGTRAPTPVGASRRP